MGKHRNLEGADLHAPSYLVVVNETGSAIAKGKVVKFDGLNASGLQKVAPVSVLSDRVIGVASVDMQDEESGFVASQARLNDVDTSAFIVDQLVYSDTNGDFTTTDTGLVVGITLKVGVSDGVIYVLTALQGPVGPVLPPALDGVLLIKPAGTTAHLTIGAALALAVSGDVVQVGPGIYAESVSVPSGVSLLGDDSMRSARITGALATGTRVTLLGTSSKIQGFAVDLPTDAVPAILYAGSTAATVRDIRLDGKGAPGKGIANTGSGTLMCISIAYISGACDRVFEVSGGILVVTSSTIAGGAIEDGFHMSGGSECVIKVMAITASVVDAFHVEDGKLEASDVSVESGQVALHLLHDDAEVEMQSFDVDAAVPTHILVEPGVIPVAIQIVGSDMDRYKIFYDAAAFPRMSLQFNDGTEGDQGFVVHGEVAIGRAQNGAELVSGEGDSYTGGMVAATTDSAATSGSDGGNITDVSVAASSASGSTFSFQGIAANHTILIGSSLDGLTDKLKHWGIKVLNTIAAVEIVKRSFAFEIWNGTAWVSIGAMATHANLSHRYANEVFIRTNSFEQMQYGITDETTWAKKTITVSGTPHTLYWSRIRVTNSLTTAPVFQQTKLSTNRFEAGIDGFHSFHGRARFITTVQGLGNIYAESGNVVNGNFAVGSGGLPTGWNHEYLNARMNQDGDAIYIQLVLSRGIDTSFGYAVDVVYKVRAADATDPTLIMSFLMQEVQGVLEADPAGGITPVARTLAETETVTSKAGQSETKTPPAGDTTKMQSVSFGPFDISDYYEGDLALVRMEADSLGTANLEILSLSFRNARWTHGEHL